MDRGQAHFQAVLKRYTGPGDTLLAAVSGGADSMAMLRMLELGAQALGLHFSVCHVHHHLRAASDAEWQFVEAYCDDRGIPFYGKHIDVKAYQEAGGRNLEASAHTLRYQALEEAARECGARWILLAHHADDRAETVLMHILRGTSVSGLDAMPERRGPYLRPMLGLKRKDIEAFCKSQGLAYVTDASNKDIRMTRNRIRHVLLPELAAYNPGLVEALNRLADSAFLQTDYMTAQTGSLYRDSISLEAASWHLLAAGPVRQAHPALTADLLQEEVLHFSTGRGRLNRDMVDHCLDLIQKGSGRYDLGEGILLEVTGRFVFIGRGLQGTWQWQDGGWVHQGLEACIVDPQYLLNVRAAGPGDRILIDKVGHKSVKKVFQEAGLPPLLRKVWPVVSISNNNSEIIWIPLLAQGPSLMYDRKERMLRHKLSIELAGKRCSPGSCRLEDL
jgi:tRNA(Ile)-lysidine synthetase-like protein